LADQFRDALQDVKPARVVVLCVGNPQRGDDGFGPAVAAALTAGGQARVFDCRTTPENDLPFVAGLEPEVVLFVDAVHFDGEPGALRLLGPDELRQDDFSTHAGSLTIAADFLSEACGARSLLLAAQPADVELGAGMSEEMERAVERATELLAEALTPSER
jgi:hydrogenase 3 maturation protease